MVKPTFSISFSNPPCLFLLADPARTTQMVSPPSYPPFVAVSLLSHVSSYSTVCVRKAHEFQDGERLSFVSIEPSLYDSTGSREEISYYKELNTTELNPKEHLLLLKALCELQAQVVYGGLDMGRGRPRKTLEETLRKDLEYLDLTEDVIQNRAQ
ncbi:hypothetical protein DVH24_034643 [Malus domestica]|uniref:Uncharacterized protein n=1 Tax=Malus domestica TaxID=3750 RepID=A0A498J1P2_MALDO|nr:hypothetical protein DVH24_034643 [Malus domestica]